MQFSSSSVTSSLKNIILGISVGVGSGFAQDQDAPIFPEGYDAPISSSRTGGCAGDLIKARNALLRPIVIQLSDGRDELPEAFKELAQAALIYAKEITENHLTHSKN